MVEREACLVLHPEAEGLLADARSVLLPFATSEWPRAFPILSAGLEGTLAALPSGSTLGEAVEGGYVRPPGLPELGFLCAQAPPLWAAALDPVSPAVSFVPAARAGGSPFSPGSGGPSERLFPLFGRALDDFVNTQADLAEVEGRVALLQLRLSEAREAYAVARERDRLASDSLDRFPVRFDADTIEAGSFPGAEDVLYPPGLDGADGDGGGAFVDREPWDTAEGVSRDVAEFPVE